MEDFTPGKVDFEETRREDGSNLLPLADFLRRHESRATGKYFQGSHVGLLDDTISTPASANRSRRCMIWLLSAEPLLLALVGSLKILLRAE